MNKEAQEILEKEKKRLERLFTGSKKGRAHVLKAIIKYGEEEIKREEEIAGVAAGADGTERKAVKSPDAQDYFEDV